jgi:hypothetical protein
MFGSYFTDIDFPLVFEPQFQISFVTIHGDGRQSFGALVLQEAGNGFVDLQTLRSLVRFRALRSLVHEKSSFLGGSLNQKPPG